MFIFLNKINQSALCLKLRILPVFQLSLIRKSGFGKVRAMNRFKKSYHVPIFPVIKYRVVDKAD